LDGGRGCKDGTRLRHLFQTSRQVRGLTDDRVIDVQIVADGTDDAEARLKRVLRNDPGMGVIRHADAGYELAKDTASKNGLDFKKRLSS